jgi:hypothetical protein
LFGDKPVSLSGDFEVTPCENTLEGMRSGGIFWKKWEIWEKYKKLFPIKNYIIIKEQANCKKFKISNIIFINKKAFIKIINDNVKLFESVLNTTIDPKIMLKNIEERKVSFRESINNNEMLWGILLGYGKHNASLYNKREHIGHNILDIVDVSLKFSTIKLDSFGDHKYSPLLLGSVHFAADLDHSETKALEKKYRELRGKISAIYAKGNFLEITLTQLTSDEEQ